jgi:hypothetical protein
MESWVLLRFFLGLDVDWHCKELEGTPIQTYGFSRAAQAIH